MDVDRIQAAAQAMVDRALTLADQGEALAALSLACGCFLEQICHGMPPEARAGVVAHFVAGIRAAIVDAATARTSERKFDA